MHPRSGVIRPATATLWQAATTAPRSPGLGIRIHCMDWLCIEANRTLHAQVRASRDVKKHVFFCFWNISWNISVFWKFFFKYFIVPDAVFLCKKIKLCATIDTVNGSMIGKTTMIILYVTYASLESKKHIAPVSYTHLTLPTKRIV